jgi:prepilin-type N-terminal cleavage/methylation domain-containing protein
MKNKGFTLIELLVGVALVSFVTLAGYTFYLNTFQFQVIQERQKDMKISLQLVMDLLVSDIRASGFGVTDPLASGANRGGLGCLGVLPASVVVANCGAVSTGRNIAITVQNNAAATTDTIVLAGKDIFIGTVNSAIVAGTNVLMIGPPVVGAVAVGDLITIGGLFSSIVTGVVNNASTSTTITLGTALGTAYTDPLGSPDTYPAGLDVYTLAKITYSIATSLVPANGEPALFRQVGAATSTQLASGIEDLQLAYYLQPEAGLFPDLNGTFPKAVSNPGFVASFRAVRVSLSARTPDPNNAFTGGYRSTLEDHPGMATTTAGDNFRRVVLTRVVELFNDGME